MQGEGLPGALQESLDLLVGQQKSSAKTAGTT